jgi:Tfp pilus assembly protein PilN
MKAARVLRGANFAYPWSERHEYYSPAQVRVLVAISASIVLALLVVPFYLQQLTRTEQREMIALASLVGSLRNRAEAADPILARRALLDSIKTELESRVGLVREAAQTDYPVDRLLLHLSEIVPDGILLTAVDISPPAAERRTGRQPPGVQTPGLPEGLQQAFVLTLSGTARNADIMIALREALMQSPLLQNVVQSESVVDSGFSFRITCRLPGSGIRLGGTG